MCYHLTSTLPKDTDLGLLRAIFEKYEMAFDPITNPHIASQLPSGELYFVTTKGHCDCGTILGALSTSKALAEILDSKKARILRKKGWSETQIAKWAKEKLESKKKSHGRKFSPIEIQHETDRWINFFQEMLQEGKVSHIGLIKHWYGGRLDTEQFTIQRTQKVRLAEVNSEFLTKIEEDVLYNFI